VPRLFGEKWAPIMEIYPFIAVGYFTNSLFNMHSAVLSLLRRNIDVAIFNFLNVGLFALTAYLLVAKFGITGYGAGEIVALASYVVLNFLTARRIGMPVYSPTAVWWIGVVIGLFWQQIGIWAIAAPFIALILPPSPSRLLYYAKRFRSR
jgi:O-antigen/teichoic acid export membrane protein